MKKITFSAIATLFFVACGSDNESASSVAPSEDPAVESSSSETFLTSSETVPISSSEQEISSSSDAAIESSETQSPEAQTPYVWPGSKDVPRDYFNSQMQQLSSDSTFLMPAGVLGFVSDRNSQETVVEKISLTDARKKFPNTIKAMEQNGVVPKDTYNWVFVQTNSSVAKQLINKLDSDSIKVMFTWQRQPDSEGACIDEEGPLGNGMSYLVDGDLDLSAAVISVDRSISHSWICGCEETDEACKFLKKFYR